MSAPSYFEYNAGQRARIESDTVEISPAELTGIHVTEAPLSEVKAFYLRKYFGKAVAGGALAALAVNLAGCATLATPEEMAWQSLHAVDVAQTMEIPGSACLREGHPLTALLIGRQPKPAGVLAWGVASAGVHLLISDQLRARNLDGAYAVWQFVSIGDSALSVGRNHGIGIRIGTRNVGKAACAS